MAVAMRTRRLGTALAMASVGGMLGLACNSLLDFGGYTFTGGPDATPFDARGDELRTDAGAEAAADACPVLPQTKAQLESACTGSACEPFDNATRNTRCTDGGTACPVASVLEAGPPMEAAAGDAASDAGSPDG